MSKLRSAENLQRVGFLSLIPAILQRYGVNYVEVLTRAGLREDALDNPDAAIPYDAMGRLLQLAAEKTQRPHIGLEIGSFIRVGSLGLVGKLMQHAPSLGVALRDFVTHQHRNAHGSVAYLLTDQQEATFGYAVYHPNTAGALIICDGAAMAALTILRDLASWKDDSAVSVLFSRSEPPELSPYRHAFGVKLRFNCDQTAVCFPRRLLELPVAGANPAIRKDVEECLSNRWHAGRLDTVTHLRRALRIELLTGVISADRSAAKLGMSRRTLYRRLNASGFRFQQILDETRCEFAQQLLHNTDMDIGRIGVVVGYTDPSVFTRSLTRWTGLLPREWRSKRRIHQPHDAFLTTDS